MSVSAVAPTPFYQDPERLPIGLPQASTKASGEGAAQTGQATDGKHLSMFAEGDDQPSFWDLVDVINPLQHIPVISDIYRELTGDKIGVGARLVGGTLFGGPIGLIAAAADCVVEESTGKDSGEHFLALFRDEGQSAPETAPATQFAAPATPAVTDPAIAPAAAEAVSSSPAKTTAGDNAVPATTPASAPQAPVIALPDGGAATGSQPMMFSLEGSDSPVAPAAASAPAAAPVQLAATNTPTAPVRLGNKGFMPVPPRAAPSDPKPAPLITAPVSSTTARSNVPITGRSPQGQMPVAAAQRAQVTQDALANHPMMPPSDANGQTAAGPDWFTAAWGQALDKYQRANQRNDKVAPVGSTTSTLQ